MRFNLLFRGEGSIRLMLKELATIAAIMFCVWVAMLFIYAVSP